MMTLFLGNRDLVAQSDVECELLAHFEIVLHIPGVVRPVECGVVGVAEAAPTCDAEQKGRPVGAAVGDIRIPRPGGAETDRAIGAIIVEPAIDPLQIFHAELEIVLALEPCHLFLEAGGPLARIGEDAIAPLDSSGAIHARSSGSKRRHRSRYISGPGPVRGGLAYVTGRLDDA